MQQSWDCLKHKEKQQIIILIEQMEKDYGKRFKRAKKDGNDDGGQLHLGYVYDILDKG